MAFVYRSERNINLSGKEVSQVGPGAYIGHRDIRVKPQVNQPFQAMTGRDVSNKNQGRQTAYNPGPGSYQPALGFDQVSKNMQSAKNLSMYGLEKFGITVIKPTNCFSSKVDRFSDKNVKEKAQAPGPGQYNQHTTWVKAKKNPAKTEWQHVTWSKMQNPPSIPSHDNIFGYEENERGDLIKQGNAEKVHKGVKSDTVGPGQYEVNKGVTPGKKGPTWHLPKSKPKVPTSSDRTSIPGPGHYNAEKVDVFPIYKYKPSSVFVSKVDRDKQLKHLQNKHSTKPQSHQNHSRQLIASDDDYYDEDDDEGTTPGPGSYFNPKQSTTFQVKGVPERLQFFGSTVERFQHSKQPKAGSSLGPGTYNILNNTQKKMRTSNYVPFSSTNQRFMDQRQTEAPGPGEYQQHSITDQIQRKPWGKQGVFGSTEKRFVQAQALQTPGPGQYKPDRAIAMLDKKKDSNIKRSSSMFISSTKRNPYEEAQNTQAAPVVQYDINSNTISDQLKKKIEGGYGNSLLTDLKLKNKVNPGFSSNAPRFSQKKVNEAEAFLGPGYYEQQSNFQPKNQVAVTSKLQNKNFLSDAPRFNDAGKKAEGPGPGQYSNEDMNNWFKRSYNMIFTQ